MMTHAEADLVKELKERLRFETLLTDISAHFVNLPAEQIDGESVALFDHDTWHARKYWEVKPWSLYLISQGYLRASWFPFAGKPKL